MLHVESCFSRTQKLLKAAHDGKWHSASMPKAGRSGGLGTGLEVVWGLNIETGKGLRNIGLAARPAAN